MILNQVAYYIFDKDLRYVHAIGNEIQNAGFDPAQIIGYTLKEAFGSIGKDQLYQFEMHYLKILGGEADSFEFEYQGEKYVQHGFPFEIEQSVIFGITCSLNLTLSESRKDRLIQIKEKLYKIAYHFAHQVRGPLATSLGLYQLWQMQKDNPSKGDLPDSFFIERIADRLLVLDKMIIAAHNRIEEIDQKEEEENDGLTSSK